MKISVLGVPYTVDYREKSEVPALEKCNGYCDVTTKAIVVKDFTEEEKQDVLRVADLEAFKHKCLRHEIVHAFLYESGLCFNTLDLEGAWATNEEMVDWMAIQGPKIYAAWMEAKCL